MFVPALFMSDEEDYLSDKFLVGAAASSSQPKTYAQRRQESLRQSRIKNEQNRLKSRRQREQESREEGLRKSLFERAKEDDEGGENKALGIMLKMGFKIGQSLGQNDNSLGQGTSPLGPSANDANDSPEPTERRNISTSSPRVEPLPLNEWTGSFRCTSSHTLIHLGCRQERHWIRETHKVSRCLRPLGKDVKDGRRRQQRLGELPRLCSPGVRRKTRRGSPSACTTDLYDPR